MGLTELTEVQTSTVGLDPQGKLTQTNHCPLRISTFVFVSHPYVSGLPLVYERISARFELQYPVMDVTADNIHDLLVRIKYSPRDENWGYLLSHAESDSVSVGESLEIYRAAVRCFPNTVCPIILLRPFALLTYSTSIAGNPSRSH
jgi:hypothetical protein